MPPPSETFAALLKRLATLFPSRRAFARAIDVDPSRLSRAMNGDPTMFDALRCLYVARVTKENPSVVLRAAGKAELAAVVEELYGEPKSPEVLDLIRTIDRVDPLAKAGWLSILQDLAQVPPTPARFTRTAPKRKRERGAA